MLLDCIMEDRPKICSGIQDIQNLNGLKLGQKQGDTMVESLGLSKCPKQIDPSTTGQAQFAKRQELQFV